MKKETLKEYLQRLKDRRTEDDYKYTDEDFEKNKKYISNCFKNEISVYKCLELMYFAEKDIKQTETIEYDLLQHIKFCLECKNESQAIRMIEQYGFEMQEKGYSEEEVLSLLLNLPNYFISIHKHQRINEWFKQFKKK